MKNTPTNKFEQLVEDLVSGRLSLLQVQIAIRAAVRQWENVPNEVKDLLCGAGEGNAGIIYRMFQVITNTMGVVELAFRRGVAVGENRKKKESPRKNKREKDGKGLQI